jgi:hypothetical protein
LVLAINTNTRYLELVTEEQKHGGSWTEKNCEIGNTHLVDNGDSTLRLTVAYTEVVV